MSLAFMAGTQDLDTGQFLTYLFILFIPFITLLFLASIFRILQGALLQRQPWALWGTCRPLSLKKIKQYKKPSVSIVCKGENNKQTPDLPHSPCDSCLPGWLPCGVLYLSVGPPRLASQLLYCSGGQNEITT